MVQNIQLTQLPQAEIDQRLTRVRAAMKDAGLDVGLAYGNEFVPGDVQYLTGYDPQIEAVAVVITASGVAVLGGPEGEAMFADQRALGDWFNFDLFEVPFQDYGDLRFSDLGQVLISLGEEGCRRVALLTDAKYVPVALADLFRDRSIDIVRLESIVAECRYRKSPLELELFARAAHIATDAARAMIDALQPGMTELEVAAIGDAAVKSGGAYAYGWDTMVLSGERVNSIIGRASNKVIQPGELVLIGAAPRYAGYCATVGRTVVAGGSPTPEQARFIDAGARALELAAEGLIEGAPAADVDRAARAHLEDEGLGAYHAYGVGHGIGFSECLELMTATSQSTYDLPRGIAMMLDVGVFRNPNGLSGRFEDPYVIDHDGVTRRLTDLDVRIGMG